MKKAVVHVSGLIQGIGFRPFVYRLAVRRGLKGRVLNLGDAGVRIELYGPEEAIRDFLRALVAEKPPIARYDRLDVEWSEAGGEAPGGFYIAPSDLRASGREFSIIPPDIAVCDECLREIYDPSDRHYMYPFTCCASCGPRFTIMVSLPYDRERTTMAEFPMCDLCSREFNDPLDRRFNAQTICCPLCGPRMALYDRDGELLECGDPLAEAGRLLREGRILAVKGIGGFHLAVRADDDDAVSELRFRRRKPRKPLAVMSLTPEDVREYAIFVGRHEVEHFYLGEEVRWYYMMPECLGELRLDGHTVPMALLIANTWEDYYLDRYVVPPARVANCLMRKDLEVLTGRLGSTVRAVNRGPEARRRKGIHDLNYALSLFLMLSGATGLYEPVADPLCRAWRDRLAEECERQDAWDLYETCKDVVREAVAITEDRQSLISAVDEIIILWAEYVVIKEPWWVRRG